MEKSNKYIFLYSTGLVVIVAALLSITFSVLKPFQDANVKNEKYQNILSSVNIISTPANAEKKYNEIIKKSFVFNFKGEINNSKKAFDIVLKDEIKKYRNDKSYEINLPVYIAEIDSKTYSIFPIYGKGLWGPIWGYVALKADLNTLHGIVLDHQGETPGLGAEITHDFFEHRFINKKLFNDKKEFVSVSVLKKGGTENNPNAIDGMSGATLTCNGVNDMIRDCFKLYENYLLKQLATSDTTSVN